MRYSNFLSVAGVCTLTLSVGVAAWALLSLEERRAPLPIDLSAPSWVLSAPVPSQPGVRPETITVAEPGPAELTKQPVPEPAQPKHVGQALGELSAVADDDLDSRRGAFLDAGLFRLELELKMRTLMDGQEILVTELFEDGIPGMDALPGADDAVAADSVPTDSVPTDSVAADSVAADIAAAAGSALADDGTPTDTGAAAADSSGDVVLPVRNTAGDAETTLAIHEVTDTSINMSVMNRQNNRSLQQQFELNATILNYNEVVHNVDVRALSIIDRSIQDSQVHPGGHY